MVTFTRILCPIDFSEHSLKALAYAAMLANRYGAGLRVLHVVPSFDAAVAPPAQLGGAGEVVYPVLRDEVLEGLHRAAKAAGAPPSRVEAEVAEGDAATRILEHTLAEHVDLVVMGTHGRGGFGRALLGSVAERVIHRAVCPVWTVPPHAPVIAGASATIARILCAVDFSPSSLLALGFAADLSRQTHASLAVLHVVEWPEHEPRSVANFAVPEYRLYLLSEARARLHDVVTRGGVAAGVDVQVIAGRAKSAILQRAADLPADLIVMGTQGHEGLDLSIFGSTTERVVRAAHCSVLSVRGIPAPAVT